MPGSHELEGVVEDEEAIRVCHWPVRHFVDLGFTVRQARVLARVPADWDTAERLLALGCCIRSAELVRL